MPLLIGNGGRAPTVLDYGAVGDGITDDTAAIQRAFDDGCGNLPAGKVFRVTRQIAVAGQRRVDTSLHLTGRARTRARWRRQGRR